jgi:hypothetical protein
VVRWRDLDTSVRLAEVKKGDSRAQRRGMDEITDARGAAQSRAEGPPAAP